MNAAYDAEKERILIEFDKKIKDKYNKLNLDDEINSAFVIEYNDLKRNLKNYQGQLEGFLAEYKKLEAKSLSQINGLKKSKSSNQKSKQKNRQDITLVFKGLRPIQEKKERM